jgi:hypothetical protein
MYSFKENEIIILLGAGASVDAGIPNSMKMISELEKLIDKDTDWNSLKNIYYYVKSSIYLSSGLHGRFNCDVVYNIETLVNTLDELIKKGDHILYPFVGAWNPTLVELAGLDFEKIAELKRKILIELRNKWIPLKDNQTALYFGKLNNFRKEYQFPLRVFSLNYDLCLETAFNSKKQKVEMGFDDKKIWNWKRLTDLNPEESPEIYYYKLHGSLDWYYNSDNNLTFSNSPQTIKEDESALIFGTAYKLQYRDPFLFLAYEFRKWTLESNLIITIGYGFGDEHINGIIQQAINNKDHDHYLLVVLYRDGTTDDIVALEDENKSEIIKQLNIDKPERVKCRFLKAIEFLDKELSTKKLAFLFPFAENPDVF